MSNLEVKESVILDTDVDIFYLFLFSNPGLRHCVHRIKTKCFFFECNDIFVWFFRLSVSVRHEFFVAHSKLLIECMSYPSKWMRPYVRGCNFENLASAASCYWLYQLYSIIYLALWRAWVLSTWFILWAEAHLVTCLRNDNRSENCTGQIELAKQIWRYRGCLLSFRTRFNFDRTECFSYVSFSTDEDKRALKF